MMKRLRIVAATVVALGAGTHVQAASIDTLALWDGLAAVSAFGGDVSNAASGVYGESFVAPGGNLVSYTFEVNTNNIALNVVAQVYAWSGQTYGDFGAGAVGPALFSSAAFVISGAGSFQAVTINTGSIALTQGVQYVALLADTGQDSGAASFGLATGTGVHPVPGDGGFNFYNNDYTLSSIAGAWDSSKDYGSLAWQANFAVPEPASMAVLSAGLFGLGVIRRRKAT